MYRSSNRLEVTRRQLVIGALGTAACSVLPGFAGTNATSRRQTLYVNTNRGMSLSLGAPALQDRPRPWTWRMVYADAWTGDPDAELDERGLEHARSHYADYWRTAFVGEDFDEPAFQNFLEGLHPHSGTMALTRQWEEYLTKTSSAAQAFDLIEDILGRQRKSACFPSAEVLDVDMQLNSAGKCVWLNGRQNIPLLREVVDRLQLPIDVCVT